MHLLGSHVGWRTEHFLREREPHLARRKFGKAKVGQVSYAVAADENIGGLDIPVQNSVLMRVMNRLGDVDKLLHRIAGLKIQIYERSSPLDQFHADEIFASASLAEFVDWNDGADDVSEQRLQPQFETFAQPGVVAMPSRDQLHRHETL